MKSTVSLMALGAMAGSAAATDVLYSKHYPMEKRDIDNDGNWNVCTLLPPAIESTQAAGIKSRRSSFPLL
jgi:hypothetical protein